MKIASSELRPRSGRQPLTQLLVGAAYVLCQLENGFMRCLAIRRGAHHRAAGEHMPVRLPDAGSSTAWAMRPLDAAAGHHERQRENAP
jgi:hypothetical protein